MKDIRSSRLGTFRVSGALVLLALGGACTGEGSGDLSAGAVESKQGALTTTLLLPSDPGARIVWQTGFNDASGMGADDTAASPYRLGDAVVGRGRSEGWYDRSPGETTWATGSPDTSIAQGTVKFEGDAALQLGVGNTRHGFRDGGNWQKDYWVDYRIRLALTAGQSVQASEWRISHGTTPADIVFKDDGSVCLNQNNGAQLLPIGTWTAGQWLRVTKSINWTAKTVSVWLNGVLVADALPFTWSIELPFINELRFFANGPAYVDAVSFYEQGPPGRFPIAYTLSRSARVSMLVKDSVGRVVRELRLAAPRSRGSHTELWDGLDDRGQPVAAGRYNYKLLATQGLNAEYLMTLGTNPNRRYDTWPGNHGAAFTLATDGTSMFIGGSLGEGTVSLVKQLLDGTRQWERGELEGGTWTSSLALDGNVLYVMLGNGHIHRLDAATGASLGAPWAVAAPQISGRIAVRNGQVVVTTPTGIAWLDGATGQQIDSAALRTVRDLKINSSNEVLIILEDDPLPTPVVPTPYSVKSLTRSAKTPRTVISSSQLVSPFRLAITSGNSIQVAENSYPEPTNDLPRRVGPAPTKGDQVKRFSSTGTLLATHGAPGGRPREGLYNGATGFLGIWDLISTPSNGFVISEPVVAPRRIARFDSATRLIKEWYGGQLYANYAEVDPGDPSLVWMDSQWGELIQAKVDYAAKTWSVRATYQFVYLADYLIDQTVHGYNRWRVRRNGSQTYLVREGTPCVLRVDEANRRLVPLVASMVNVQNQLGSMYPQKAETLRRLMGTTNANANAYIWMDRAVTGRPLDGIPQADEMHFSGFGPNWDIWAPGDGFNYYSYDGQTMITRLAMQGWSNGVPQYPDWTQRTQPVMFPAIEANAQQGATNVFRLSDQTLFASLNADGAHAGGLGVWSARVGANRVMKWNSAGQLQWMVGQHSLTEGALPGEGRYFWRILGNILGSTVVADVDQSLVHVWDTDGLWVGRLLENPNLAVAPAAAYALGGENFGSSIFRHPTTGDVIFIGAGINNSPVYKITGWDQFQRLSGTVTAN